MGTEDPNGPGEVGINVSNVRMLVCPEHEVRLAEDVSVNSIIFPLEVLQAVLRDERTWLACGWDHDTGEKADVGKVTEFLPKIAPACEWIAPGALHAAWQRAGVLGPAPHRHHEPPRPS